MRRMLLVAVCLTLLVALPVRAATPISLRLGGDILLNGGPGVFSHTSTIGSQMRHCASTSSSRVKSVASPRMASMISLS